MFEIEVHYRETDSFNSYENKTPLAVYFETLEDARECLLIAQEHFKYLKELRSLNRNGRPLNISTEDLIKQYKSKSWFDTSVDEKDFSYNSEHSFKYKNQSIHCFYGACYNTLYSMEIKYVRTDQDIINYCF